MTECAAACVYLPGVQQHMSIADGCEQEADVEQPEEEEAVAPLSPLTFAEERVVQCRLCDCMVTVRTLDTHVVQVAYCLLSLPTVCCL